MSTTVTPWGSFTVLLDEPHYKVKQLTVKPHARLSLQYHNKRSEYMIVTEGEPIIQLGDESKQMVPGMLCFIPEGKQHRVANISDEPIVIVEIQMGMECIEEDIVRIEDDYNRVENVEDTPIDLS